MLVIFYRKKTTLCWSYIIHNTYRIHKHRGENYKTPLEIIPDCSQAVCVWDAVTHSSRCESHSHDCRQGCWTENKSGQQLLSFIWNHPDWHTPQKISFVQKKIQNKKSFTQKDNDTLMVGEFFSEESCSYRTPWRVTLEVYTDGVPGSEAATPNAFSSTSSTLPPKTRTSTFHLQSD